MIETSNYFARWCVVSDIKVIACLSTFIACVGIGFSVGGNDGPRAGVLAGLILTAAVYVISKVKGRR